MALLKSSSHTHTHAHAHKPTLKHAQTHAHTRTGIHTHTLSRTHTHTHTHKHKSNVDHCPSLKKFWNFNKFEILKTIKINKNPHYKEIFKLISLEILLRATLSNNYNYLKDIMTNKGLEEFKLPF